MNFKIIKHLNVHYFENKRYETFILEKKSKVGIKTSTIDFFSKLKFIKITVGNMKMVIENKLKANKPTLFNICNISVNDEKL